MISVFRALMSLRRVSTFGERVENSGMYMIISKYHGNFTCRGMLKEYTCKAYGRFTDIGKDLANMPTVDEQDARMVEEEEKVVATEPAAAVLPAVDVAALLTVNEDDDWKLGGAVGSDEVEHVGVKRKLREGLGKCCAKRRKVPTSVVKLFTLASELLGSVEAYTPMAVRATRLNRGEDLEVEL